MTGSKGFMKALSSWSVSLVYGMLLFVIVGSLLLMAPNKNTTVEKSVSNSELIQENDLSETMKPVFKPVE